MNHYNAWTEAWRADGFDLSVEEQTIEGMPMHRVVAKGGQTGAVAIATARDRILLVRHFRPAIGETLWEFPRGFGETTDEDAAQTALREFVEETGFSTESGEEIGRVYADSGLLANQIAVVVIKVESDVDPGVGDGEVLKSKWFAVNEVRAKVASNQIRDGITLAAWAMWTSAGQS